MKRARSKPVAAGPRRHVTFAAFGIRNYRIYAGGAIVSNVGTWMQRVAQDWLVWQLTGSALAVGLAATAQFLPALVLSYPGGIIADRWNRRSALLVSQAHMAIPSLTIGVLAVTSTLTSGCLFALILWFGCATAIDAPLRHAFVADLVSNRLLPNAVGLNSASFNVAQLMGPAIGGLLISALGSGVEAAGWVVLGNGFSFAVAAFALWRLDTTQFIDRGHGTSSRGELIRERGSPRAELVAALLALLAVGVFGLVFRSNNVLMATVTFGSGATTFGLLNTLLAIGSCRSWSASNAADASPRSR